MSRYYTLHVRCTSAATHRYSYRKKKNFCSSRNVPPRKVRLRGHSSLCKINQHNNDTDCVPSKQTNTGWMSIKRVTITLLASRALWTYPRGEMPEWDSANVTKSFPAAAAAGNASFSLETTEQMERDARCFHVRVCPRRFCYNCLSWFCAVFF